MAVTGEFLTQVSIGAVALYTLVTAASRAIDRFLALAEYYDVPEVLVGMTVIAVGTSLPELSAHVVGSAGIVSGLLDYEITSAVVLGGNTGSSTVQQFLLVGVLVIGYGSVHLSRELLRATYLPMLLAFGVTMVVGWDGGISRLDGLVLLAVYVGFVAWTIRLRERTTTPGERPSENPRRDALFGVAFLALVLMAASLLLSVVDSVVSAMALGGSTVGVVTLGVASALPELTAVVDAIRRRAPNLAVGTLLGSNVVNTLIGFGLGGAISTYYVPSVVVLWDLPFKLLAGVGIAAYVLAVRDGELTRTEGGYLVGLYFVFIAGRLLLFPGQ